MITAGREVWRYRWKIGMRTHVKNRVHTDHYVEQEMTVEKPVTCWGTTMKNYILIRWIKDKLVEIFAIKNRFITRIVSTESEYDVSVVRYCDRVLGRWEIVFSVQESSSIEIESVLQIDLLHVLVRRSTHTDHVECVTVQVEGMREIWLLYCGRLMNFLFRHR